MSNIINMINHALTPLTHSGRRHRQDNAEQLERLPTERERLMVARKAAFDKGCQLTRLARECDHEADLAFREARQIAEQLTQVKS